MVNLPVRRLSARWSSATTNWWRTRQTASEELIKQIDIDLAELLVEVRRGYNCYYEIMPDFSTGITLPLA
jgi:hypothetical protein